MRSFPVRFDATVPSVALHVTAGSRMAVARWRAAPDARSFILSRWISRRPETRTIVYHGVRHRHVDAGLIDRRRYRYALVAIDRAGNRTIKHARARPHRALVAPAARARLTTPPVLRWTPVLRAQYYNVQLVRNGRTILTAWPVRPRFALRSSWSHNGRVRTLGPGTYRWHVWAGIRRKSRRDYGLPIGYRYFEMTQAQ